jgi:hypothetical protein
MSHSIMPSAPVELTDLELDAVAGGASGSLINVDVDLRNINVDVIDDVTVQDVNVAVVALSSGVFTQR